MSVTRKGLYVLALMASAVAAHAEITFSNLDATIKFEDDSTFDLNVIQGPQGLDIFAGDMPMYVDNVNADHTFATITVEYDATSDEAINQLDLMFTGYTVGTGTVAYEESVYDDEDNLLDSVSGVIGGNTPFVQSDTLTFDGENSIHVVKTFTLELNRNTDGISLGGSLASVGIIQQNAVPEPATMGALAMGALGLLARRRRK